MKGLGTSRFLSHVAQSWRHHASLQFATLIVLIAGFAVTTGVLTISDNLQRILTLWGSSMQMSIYLNDGASPDNLDKIKKFVQDSEHFAPAKYVSKEEALNSFREQIASYAPDILKDPEILKFIPASLQLGVKQELAISDHLSVMEEAATALRNLPGVDDVSYGQEWVKNYQSVVTFIYAGGAVFIVIITLSALFVMANSVHNSINQRRAEIEVLELIGATSRYIRAPFVGEGALIGFVSCSLALGVTYAIFQSAKQAMQKQMSFLQIAEHLRFLSPFLVFALVALATLLGAFSAWLCVRKINTGWAASQAGVN